jgi:hypothetical protein
MGDGNLTQRRKENGDPAERDNGLHGCHGWDTEGGPKIFEILPTNEHELKIWEINERHFNRKTPGFGLWAGNGA